MEIADIIDAADLETIGRFERGVLGQHACRAFQTGRCNERRFNPDTFSILIDKEKRAWVYCPNHASEQGAAWKQRPIGRTAFLDALTARKAAIERAAEAARQQAAAAATAAAQAESAAAEAARQEEARLEQERQSETARVESFLTQGGDQWFANWVEADYDKFLELFPESPMCATNCGSEAIFVLFVPEKGSLGAKAAELHAACGECRTIAEALPRNGSYGAIHAFAYPAFRNYFISLRDQKKSAASITRLKQYLDRFNEGLGRKLNDEELDEQIRNLDPALRSQLQAKADAAGTS